MHALDPAIQAVVQKPHITYSTMIGLSGSDVIPQGKCQVDAVDCIHAGTSIIRDLAHDRGCSKGSVSRRTSALYICYRVAIVIQHDNLSQGAMES